MRRLLTWLPSAVLVMFAASVLFFLYEKGKTAHPLASALTSGEIVVLTVNGPTTYFEDASGGIAGLEYDLARRFADSLGLNVRFEVLASESELIAAVEARRGHLAAGTLLPTPAREKRVRFGPTYQVITQQVIGRSDQPRPREVKDLVGKRIGVLAESHHAERLAELRSRVADINWTELDGEDPDELFRRLTDGSLDLVITDSNWYALSRYFYPDVVAGFQLGNPQPLAWAFPLGGDDFLYEAAKEFFAGIRKDGSLKTLISKYYDDARSMNRIDVGAFIQQAQTVLPRYRGMFEEAQQATGIDWRLIAAIGYQESHGTRRPNHPPAFAA